MDAAPFFDDIAFGPDGGAAHWLTTSDGVKIRVAHWHMDQAKGTVLIFPGRTEYVEKYGEAALELQNRGYASLAIDWRGQGLADRMTTDRRLGHVDDFSDYQKDVDAALNHAKALDLPRPYYLLAHSMGGCIGLRSLHEGLDVQAAAFSAPMWGMALAPWMKPAVWAMPILAKRFGKDKELTPTQSLDTYVLREDFELNTLTCDRSQWERLQAQVTAHPDLALGGPTLGWMYAAGQEMDALHDLPSPALPCVTFLGTAEKIVSSERIRNRMQRWSDSHLEILKGAEHEVMVELPATRTRVYDMTAALFARHS